jgi:hypothetical protein
MAIHFLHPMTTGGNIDAQGGYALTFSGVVDAHILADNWTGLFATINGGLSGQSFDPDASLPETRVRTYTTALGSPPVLLPVLGGNHSHDGVGSALLGANTIKTAQINRRSFGAYMSLTAVPRTLMLFGSLSVKTGGSEGSSGKPLPVHELLCVPFNHGRFRELGLYRTHPAGVQFSTYTFVSDVWPDGASVTSAVAQARSYPVSDNPGDSDASLDHIGVHHILGTTDTATVALQWVVVGNV